ncbi:hypothetical protein [Parasitella parasitica]|uniref:Arrestin-like N-terminal domain-containing protein n=1 Tax=Parasitella parasitica TaxID=35722 RepID=A0A0B7N7N0_9FUNG|nr:hypothetical protein [Parasitella parasitica]
MTLDQCFKLSMTLGQSSFPLSTRNSTAKVFGAIHLTSESTCFKAPSWTQIRLVGKERAGNTTRAFLDDTYHLSSQPTDWVFVSSNQYSLPFSLSSIPNNIPSSFHIDLPSANTALIYYTLSVTTSASADQKLLQPIHLHRTYYPIAPIIAILPKRTFWGITNQSKQQRWQYELEFPNTVNLGNTCESISVRLKAMFPVKKNECCLVGYQVVQLLHLVEEQKGGKDEEIKSQNQVLATGTHLLTSPNKSWSQPCQMTLTMDSASILPSMTESQRVAVEHYIKFTFAFCDSRDDQVVSLEFPMTMVGYTSAMISRHFDQINMLGITSSSNSCNSSIADELDSAIDVLSFKSSCSNNNYLTN